MLLQNLAEKGEQNLWIKSFLPFCWFSLSWKKLKNPPTLILTPGKNLPIYSFIPGFYHEIYSPKFKGDTKGGGSTYREYLAESTVLKKIFFKTIWDLEGVCMLNNC